MSRKRPKIGDVVRMLRDYSPSDSGQPRIGDLGVIVDYERESENVHWWIVQTFNGGRDGYSPGAWRTYFEIVEEKKDGTHVQEQ